MRKLTKKQVRLIELDLTKRDIHYPPLKEDLLDHICTEVETKMAEGMKFQEAHQHALSRFLPNELKHIHSKTISALTSFSLLKSYFQTAYRNLLKRSVNSFINVSGLTVSMAICILIFIFIRYESSFDTQHPDKTIYRLTSRTISDSGHIENTAFTGAPWGPALVEEFPELLDAGRIMKYRLDVLVTNRSSNTSFYESDLIWGDQQLLAFFKIDLITGNQETALSQPNRVVISEEIAKKYFGNTDPMGKILTYNNEVDLVVSGVMSAMPEKMHFGADLICSFSTLKSFWRIIDNWTIRYYHTYLKVRENADIENIEAQFPDFFERKIGDGWNERRSAFLQKVIDIHLTAGTSNELKPGTNKQYLYILVSVAIIILILACANFINLNIARSIKRTKEMGIRKVMGGMKSDLVLQFVLESGVLTFLSLVLSLGLAQLLLPFFNELLSKELTIFGEFDGLLIVYVLLIVILVSVLTGIYSAISTGDPGIVHSLKGKSTERLGGNSIGDGLMVFQFVICTTLIISIGVIKLQQHYLQTKDLGYSPEQLLMISTNNVETTELSLLRTNLLSIPEVSNVSITSHKLAGDQPYYSSYVFSASGISGDTLGLGRLHVDEGFIDTYDLRLVAGRDYDPAISTDTTSFLVNEKTLEILGVTPEQALDMTIEYLTQGENGRYPRRGKIIGVLANFHLESMHQEIDGLVMDIQPPRSHFVACKLSNRDVNASVISKIESEVKVFASDMPIEYFFLKDLYGNLYSNERKLDVLISIASGVVVIIAFMGLFGLVSQLAAYKKSEIGVRKVLGASVLSILLMFAKKYIRIILISLLVAFPLSYYCMNSWLLNYPYRIDFPLLLMFAAGLLLMLFSILTIVFVVQKAASVNPITVLKED